MSIYELINESVLSLFPSELTPQLRAYTNLLSLVLISLVVYCLLKFIVWVFGLFSRIGR